MYPIPHRGELITYIAIRAAVGARTASFHLFRLVTSCQQMTPLLLADLFLFVRLNVILLRVIGLILFQPLDKLKKKKLSPLCQRLLTLWRIKRVALHGVLANLYSWQYSRSFQS